MKKIGKRLLAVVLLMSMSMGMVLSYLPNVWKVDASDNTTLDYSFVIKNQEDFGTRLDNDFNVYRYGEFRDVEYNFMEMDDTKLAATGTPANEYNKDRSGSPNVRRVKGETKSAENFWTITNRGLEPKIVNTSQQFFKLHVAEEQESYELKFKAKGGQYGIDIGSMDYIGHADKVDTGVFGFSVQSGGTQLWMNGTNIDTITAIAGCTVDYNTDAGVVKPTTAVDGYSTREWTVSVSGKDVVVSEETTGLKFSFKIHDGHVKGQISLRGQGTSSTQATNTNSVQYHSVSVKYFDKISASTVGEPSTLATTTIENTKNNNYLKLKDVAGGEKWTGEVALMTYMTEVVDFTAEYELFLGYANFAGLILGGEAGSFPISLDDDNTNDTGVMIWLDHDGKLNMAGAIKRETTNYLGSTQDGTAYWSHDFIKGVASVRGGSAITDKRHSSKENLSASDKGMTVVVTVDDGLLTVYEKDTPDKIVTVELSASYQGGYVSLYQNNYNTSFRSFKIKEVPAKQAEEGDAFTKDFTTISGSAELNAEFNSYYYESDSAEAVKGEPSEQWSTAKDLADYPGGYQNNFLKPTHKLDVGGTRKSLLTYQKLIFRNVDITTEYVPKDQNYGIMVAPAGELATAKNGLCIYVEGNGTINIKGAIDAATGSATGGYAKVSGRNHLTGYSLNDEGYVSATSANGLGKQGKTYKLHASISGDTLCVWLEEFSDYKIAVTLTDDYKGGMVSLYSNGYNYGESFKSFAAHETANIQVVKDDTLYTQSFNTISALNQLTDYKAYTLKNIEEEPKEENIGDVFRLSEGRLRSNMVEGGTYADDTNFGILTLTKKRYENFELTLKYQQNSLRYGVMFGTEEGEFVYKKDGNTLRGNGGVFTYTELEGYRNIKGSLDPKAFTDIDAAQQLRSQTKDTELMASFSAFTADGVTNAVATARQKPIHTMTIRVVDGCMTMVIDNNESSRVTVRLSDYDGGYISLVTSSPNSSTDYGAFLSLSVKELDEDAKLEVPAPDPFEDVQAQEAVAGDYFSKDFTELSSVEELDSVFDAYHFDTEDAPAMQGDPSMQWTNADNLVEFESYKNNYLKPKHTVSGTKQTLLTYQSKTFKNVDIAAEYVPNHLRYGIMIAPKGELASAQNGVRIYVEGSGSINIEGAIDAASGAASGGYVYVNNSHHLKGYSLSSRGYVNFNKDNSKETNSITYELHARISGNTLSVWLGEFSDYVITVTLTDAYAGGMVSLYATGYNHGGFKSFAAKEMDNVEVEKDDTIYTQSFNTISSLDELTDFQAYTLTTVEEKPAKATIGDVFKLENGKLSSNAEVSGTYDDETNFGILTLTNRRYENFELTLKYQQNSLRYGVMFGTEEGEFAYSKKGNSLRGNGGVFAYTEMEGYRNIKGSVDAKAFSGTSDAKKLLARATDSEKLPSFTAFTAEGVNNVTATLRQTPIHTMTIRVVNGQMTMLIDNNESSRVTIGLSEYEGGYISLVTSSKAEGDYGAFLSLSVKELGTDAKLETELPEISEGFNSINIVEDMFDAYYLANVKESNKYEKAEVADRWFVNKDGFVSKTIAGSGIQINEGVDILTYKNQEFTDFELTYTFQQAYSRLGVIIGGDKEQYPLDYSTGKFTADKAAMFYIEAEGKSVVKGHLHNYTSKSDLWYRITNPLADGYTDAAGNAADNVSAKKVHEVKLVVKDKQLYVFLDGSKEATLYVKLGDNYKGGYVSLFSTANSNYGFGSFEISKKITMDLPKAGGTSSSNNTFVANFDTAKFDSSKFTPYYLEAVKGNTTGDMTKEEFDDQWTIVNGQITRTTEIANGSDATKVSVLTYDKAMTNFVATYDYQQDTNRLMFMFGTEKGKYPLYEGQGGLQKPNGGVVLYPEYDMGEGGGIVVLGDALPATTSHRPLRRLSVQGIDYYAKDSEVSYKGNWHTMTVAVINKQCYIYLDDYGLVDHFALPEDYDGGYLSIASCGNAYGFDNLKITEISSVGQNAVVATEVPRHLTVQVGTESEALQLPTFVNVTLKNGKTAQGAVEWKNFNYDSSKEGIYKYTGVVKNANGIENPAMVGVELEIKVVNALSAVGSNVKEWSFDTKDDMNDFSTTYLQDVETGYITKDVPQWWVSQGGKLCRDEYRTVNGTDKENLGIFTYTGQTYKNFELEVDYSWSSTRMMVMFGSEKIGQYIDLTEMKSDKNPSAVFVEMEGVRNVIGNVRNTDYYRRTETTISSARENGDRIPNYYNADNLTSNKGTMRHMRIRVVGDKVSVWIGDHAEPFVATLTNYKGGYISLVSCSKGGMFDNLKITRLSDDLVDDPVENVKAIANGTMNLTIDTNASTQLEIPKSVAPETFGTENELSGKDALADGISTRMLLLSGSIVLSSLIAGALIILLALNKRKKGDAK